MFNCCNFLISLSIDMGKDKSWIGNFRFCIKTGGTGPLYFAFGPGPPRSCGPLVTPLRISINCMKKLKQLSLYSYNYYTLIKWINQSFQEFLLIIMQLSIWKIILKIYSKSGFQNRKPDFSFKTKNRISSFWLTSLAAIASLQYG